MQHVSQIQIPELSTAKPSPPTTSPSDYENLKWDFKFQTFGETELEKMLKAAKQFAWDMKTRKEPYWLSYLGSSGAGKTLLAASLWAFFYEVASWYRRKDCDALNVHTGQFLYWPNYVDEMKNGDYSRGKDLRDDWFVVIDDIGAEHTVSNNANKQLGNILSARLGKWTVLTSNKSLQQIKDDMDTRIASRMLRNNSALIDVRVLDFNDREQSVNPFENL